MLAATLATAVSAVFAVWVLARYARRRRPQELGWGIGLALFSLGNLAAVLARTDGATADEYRLFYLFGAILNVTWLAVGTLYITAPRAIADGAFVFAYAFSVVSVFAVFASPVDLTAALDTGRGFHDSLLPRILAGVGSGAGSVVLIGGALRSAWVFMRRRHQGRRALANVIIAAGVFVAAAGGTATLTGGTGLIEITNLVGVTLIFVGFLIA